MAFVPDVEEPQATSGRFVPDERRAATKDAGRPLPLNAGIASLGASVVGLPMDTIQNAANLGIAGFGSLKSLLTGKPGPSLISNIPGGSENIKGMLRATGAAGLNPDNPTPDNKIGTAQYEFVSRGGIIPGGALSAVGSMVAEKVGGPEWAGVGAMTPAALSAGVNAIPRPTLTPQAKLLNDAGVSMTPGQIIGGKAQRMEDAATSIPVLGDSIKAAQRRGIESFDAAAINRALEPIGAKLPNGAKGNMAIEYARTKLGDAYESLLPNMKGDLHGPAAAPGTAVTVPGGNPNLPAAVNPAARPTLKMELDNIRSMGQNLPEPQRGQLGRIIDREVLNRFTPSGLASGQTLKNIESELNRLSTDFRRSDNYDTRTLGKAVEETQAAMRRMIENVNPSYAGDLAKINEGYANFKKVQNAAANIGAKEGVFTPAQLQRSVRAGDTTKDKRAFSEGDALMQDLSSAGKSTLAQTVPDSGTPFRGALMYAMMHPLKAGLATIPIGMAASAYSPAAQGTLQSFLTSGGKPPRAMSLQEIMQQAIIANQGMK